MSTATLALDGTGKPVAERIVDPGLWLVSALPPLIVSLAIWNLTLLVTVFLAA